MLGQILHKINLKISAYYRPPLDAVGEILESYNRFDELKSYGGSGENLDPNEELRTGHLSLAVEMLQKTFLQNKEVSCIIN